MHDAHIVTAEDLEASLHWAKAQAPSPTAGLFGPDSITWRIDREAILFLAAGQALLMQLAHPWVAQGVADHSISLDDPIGRFHRTFSAMFNFVFGTVDQALDAARRLHRRHQGIHGVLQHAGGPFAAGSLYTANHLPALRWVLLTLTDGAITAYEAVLPSLSTAERDRYVAENRLMGAMFGIPPDALPQDWRSFEIERESRLGSGELTVTPPALHIAERLVVHPPLWIIPDSFRTITARLLPERLRNEYRLGYGTREQRSAARALGWIKGTYPKLPALLRYVGPYHEALGRLRGRARPAPATRVLNRIWIGAAALPGPGVTNS
jgi:uncharacterized protein (DUF2236 family)